MGEPSQNDLELIRRHRGEHSRIGFAVQVGTARFLRALLADPLDVPWAVVDYVAAQLGIADPSVVKPSTERVETAKVTARAVPQGTYRTLPDQTHEASADALAPLLTDFLITTSEH